MYKRKNDAFSEQYQAALRSHPRVHGWFLAYRALPGQFVCSPYAFFFTSLMLENVMPSARSLV